MKAAFICDPHMPDVPVSPQEDFFRFAVASITENKPDCVISLGDMTSMGEIEAMKAYLDALSDTEHYWVLGNAEVRTPETIDYFMQQAKPFVLSCGSRRIIGFNTPYGKFEDAERALLNDLHDGDILVMHHGPDKLAAPARAEFDELLHRHALTVIHAHEHNLHDYMLGRSHIIGLRALDPDKSIGGPPCITMFDIADTAVTYREVCFGIDKETLRDVRAHFGLSCVDNHRDVAYALEHDVKYVELRCNGKGWTPDETLIPLLDAWRKKTGGYLSVHMPNLHYRDGAIAAVDTWDAAIDYAVLIGADAMTIHPPRVSRELLFESEELWNEYLELYLRAVRAVAPTVRVGIENLHVPKGFREGDDQPFGCTPGDVCHWIDALNDALESTDRVGHILDVGHARNNAHIATPYPVGRWYTLTGHRAVGYHIHQVARGPEGYSNHSPIVDWYGPMINYASFFHAWKMGWLRHAPVFLEVKGCENFRKSIAAFAETFGIN